MPGRRAQSRVASARPRPIHARVEAVPDLVVPGSPAPRLALWDHPLADPNLEDARIPHALAGLAGATKALVFQLASLTDVHWTMSGEVVLMTLVGGLGTIFGPVVGAFFIITLENYLTTIGHWVFVVQGSIFVVCVLAFRKGIVGELQAWIERRRARAIAAAPDAPVAH